MDIPANALLITDTLLMGAMLYLLYRSRHGKAAGPGPARARAVERAVRLLKEKTERMEARLLELQKGERELKERNRRLDRAIRGVEGALGDINTAISSLGRDNNYQRAIRMLKMGEPEEKVIKSLGLTRGEMELISSLSSLS